MSLPFTHGIEIENHLVDIRTGRLITGDILLQAWKNMFEVAEEFLLDLPNDPTIPIIIKNKIKKIEVAEEIKHDHKLRYISIEYKIGDHVFRTNAFGPDPNLSQITWLLELVTPPCNSLEEIRYWIETLYTAANLGLSILGIKLLPIGINPLEEQFRSGLSCGEHHHIGNLNQEDKIAAYNLLRNYVPHLISLTANSPFIYASPQGEIIIKKNFQNKNLILPKNCTRSFRLKYNTGQLGPNSVTYLPWLPSNATRTDFATAVRKEFPEDRFVDIYPFTDYGTIELRFFDASPWMKLRLALVLLLQAICLKAKKLQQSNKNGIPGVSSQILFENRGKAIDFSFQGKFFSDDTLDPKFGTTYHINPVTHKKNNKLFMAIIGLILFLEDEITSIVGYEQYFSPIFAFLIGTDSFEAPFGVAELELYYWAQEHTKQKNFFLIFDKISDFLNNIPQISFKEFKEQIANKSHLFQNDVPKKEPKRDIKRIAISSSVKTPIKAETKKTNVFKSQNQPINAKVSNNKTTIYNNLHSTLESVLSQRVSSKKEQRKQQPIYEESKKISGNMVSNLNKSVESPYIDHEKRKNAYRSIDTNELASKISTSTPSINKQLKSPNKKSSILSRDNNSANIVKKEQFKELVSEKFKDHGEKSNLVIGSSNSSSVLPQILNVAKKDESVIHFRISQAMQKKRKIAESFLIKKELESRDRQKKFLDIGKRKLVIVPQDYQTQWYALLQLEFANKDDLNIFYTDEFFISLTFKNQKTAKTVFIDYGPYNFEILPYQKAIYFPILISIENIPRNTPIHLDFRTKTFVIIHEQTIKIPFPQNLSKIGCLIKDFFVDETIGPAQIYANIHFDPNIKYKGSLQLLVFNQVGIRNLWEKKIQIKSENSLLINERIFMPPNIHLGRVVLGLSLEGKIKDTGTWNLIEFLPKVNPLIEWKLLGFEGLQGFLKAGSKYQFFPEIVFNVILRQPELSFIMTSTIKSTKNKIILKEKIKDTTYLGMAKMLRNKIELKIHEPGIYKILLIIKTDDGDVPLNLISKPIEFNI